jgi:hypothetical protein
MTYTTPNVYYATTFDGTYTKLDGIQSVLINRGKSRFQDPATASRCSIEIIPNSSFPSITIGQFIDIRDANNGSSSAYFVGRITDIQRTYAIPYNSSTGATPGDRVVISVTGGTGVLAASATTAGNIGTPVDATYYLMTIPEFCRVYAITPQNIGYDYTVFGSPTPIGQNVIAAEEQAWRNFNNTLNTVQYSVDDLDLNRTFKGNTGGIYDIYAGVYSYPTGQTGKSISFVDDGSTGATVYKYSQVEYASSIQSAFTQVIVESTLAAQDINNGNPPFVGLNYQSVVATTGQAITLGNYILTVNSSTTPTPFNVVTTTNLQDNAAALGKILECPIGTAVTFKFRGTTVSATVCGISASYYPDRANIRLTLSPSLGTPFTLDSTAFGVLDTNRLGYP